MSDHVYKHIELTGSSKTSMQDAIENAVERACDRRCAACSGSK